MSMKKNLFLIFSLLLWVPVALPAQVVEKVLDIFGGDSLAAPVQVVTVDSDSIRLSAVQEELAASRLNEANLRMEIEQMKLAVDVDGVNLLGYTPWGCIDLVSAGTGEMEKRYGFIYVDKDNKGQGTLERKPKLSFNWYKKVIASNGEDLA